MNRLIPWTTLAASGLFLALPLAGRAIASPQTGDLTEGSTTVKEEEPQIDPLVLPNDEANQKKVEESLEAHADAAKKLKTEWIDYLGIEEDEVAVAISDHCQLVVAIEPDAAKTLAQIGEYVYRRLNYITYGKLEANTFKAGGGRHLYYQTSRDSYEDMVLFLSEKHPRTISKSGAREILRNSNVGGYSLAIPEPMHLSKNAGDFASWVANGMGHHWAIWNTRAAHRETNIKSGQPQGWGSKGRGRGQMLDWLSEGLGIWSSIEAIGINRMNRFTKSLYANSGRPQHGRDTDYIAIAYEVATNKISKKIAVKNFYQLTRAGLNDLTDIDLAMAWSMIDYMIRERTSSWRSMIKLSSRVSNFRYPFINAFGSAKQITSAKRAMKNKDDRGLSQVYMDVCKGFEGDWRKWAKKFYRAAYRDPAKAVRETPFAPLGGAAAHGDDEHKGKKKPKKRRRRRR